MTTPTMHTRTTRFMAAVLVVLSMVSLRAASAGAQEAEEHGPYFGEGNIPTMCLPEMPEFLEDDSRNPNFWLRNTQTPICHHMRSDMNGLDSPKVDVLVLVPALPTVERDMRVMRQTIEMWEAGIDYVAQQLELDWLAAGMDFHVTVDAIDVDGGGGEFTTYPIVDPEIVVAGAPGAVGIGVDPIDFTHDIAAIFGRDVSREGPCHGVRNPFDIEAWENVPGFDSHHEARSGTYVEDCGGAGGNICFAVNTAIDPGGQEFFDLVAHEVGHCLTIGHVGDGAEGDWGGTPTNDIMAYSNDPPGLTKCVSSLDVESIATVMSRYLDVNGDGAVTETDELKANDQIGDGSSPFQVQRPDEHFYASSTGAPTDCPQPDLGLVPGERTDWTPDPAEDPPA